MGQVNLFCELSALFSSTEITLPTTMQATYTQVATILATITGKSHLLTVGMKKDYMAMLLEERSNTVLN